MVRRLVSIGVVSSGFAIAGLIGPASAQAPREPEIQSWLDRYVAGDVAASSGLTRPTDTRRAIASFERAADRWVGAMPASEARRRLVASSFALDAARGWVGTTEWREARDLLAWACDRLHDTQVALPAERWWHLAAIDLAESAADWSFLVGQGSLSGSPPPARGSPLEDELSRGHLTHASARFPDEPRFQLARVVAADSRLWEVSGFGNDPKTRSAILVGEIDADYLRRLARGEVLREDGQPRRDAETRSLAAGYLRSLGELPVVAAAYEKLAANPSLAAEATLRGAHVALRLGDRTGARQRLREVERLTTDPSLRYLGRLFLGVLLDRQQDEDGAIAAYRSALGAVPHAQSATALLAARLSAMGREAEAAEVVDAFFAGGTPPADPWLSYRAGDARWWTTDMTRLRAEWR
jgi:hypothetical protein